jgi:hypothetical protein
MATETPGKVNGMAKVGNKLQPVLGAVNAIWEEFNREKSPEELQLDMIDTYSRLRVGLAVIGAAFPITLLMLGWLWHDFPAQSELSAYYWVGPSGQGHLRKWLSNVGVWPAPHLLDFFALLDGDAPLRSWFVGILFGMGMLLFLYKGYNKLEDYLLNFAGLFAVLVALFPMEWGCESTNTCGKGWPWHVTFAVLFFVCISLVGLVCSRTTVRHLDPIKEQHYTRQYKWTAFFMMAFAPFAWLLAHFVVRGNDDKNWSMLLVEVLGIGAFVYFWIVKTQEIAEVNVRKALSSTGKSSTPPQSADDGG